MNQDQTANAPEEGSGEDRAMWALEYGADVTPPRTLKG